jgi:hypothetical protein
MARNAMQSYDPKKITLNDKAKFLYLDLIPNPVSDKVNIRYSMNAVAGSLTLMNIQGRVLKSINLNESTKSFDLQTSDFAPGIYFVLLKGNDGKQMMKKLAVIR